MLKSANLALTSCLCLCPIIGIIGFPTFGVQAQKLSELPETSSHKKNILLSQIPQPPQPVAPPDTLQPQPPKIELLIPEDLAPSEQNEIPTNTGATVTVQDFQFVGSTVFTSQQLKQVVQSYLDRPISFAELLQVRNAITQFYLDQGYITSGAYIPPQTIENGVVTVQIVEGSLEEIKVAVEGKLNPNYVRDRLNLGAGQPLNVDRLLEALQLLQLNPIIDRISAELSSGVSAGTSILDVKVAVADTFTPQIILDNGRNPQVGSFRRGIQLEELNLFGYGDKARFWYLNTDGTNDIDVAYSIPVNARNGEVSLEYRYVAAELIEEPFEQLDIDSDYQKYSLSYRQPVYQTPTQEFVLGLSFDHQTSQSRLGDFGGFPFRGTDNEGRTKISSLRFAQEWTQRSEKQVLATRSEFSLGVDLFDTTTTFDEAVNSDAPTSDYFLWRGQLQWVRLLAPDTLLVMGGNIQLADRPVVSLEQFGLGGLGSIIGYRQNYLLTDNGVFGAAELRVPIYSQGEHLLQIIPFVNVGRGWNSDNSVVADNQTLASAGLGLQWQYSDRVSARIDWGIPIVPVQKEGTTLQDNGLIFSVIIQPF